MFTTGATPSSDTLLWSAPRHRSKAPGVPCRRGGRGGLKEAAESTPPSSSSHVVRDVVADAVSHEEVGGEVHGDAVLVAEAGVGEVAEDSFPIVVGGGEPVLGDEGHEIWRAASVLCDAEVGIIFLSSAGECRRLLLLPCPKFDGKAERHNRTRRGGAPPRAFPLF
uniref:Uncharacterized protein n=1 Tax=Oryza meridionalis TaxID=40149 RepID=A0A0E0E224_9ORYZ